MNDKQKVTRFRHILLGLAEVYGKTLSEPGLDMWYRVMSGYPMEQIEAACMSIVETRKYTSMPTPAELIEFMGGGAAEDIAEVEAGKVLDAIRTVGPYSSVVFDNATTMAVIAHGFGGWQKLCEMREDEEKWFRKDFVRIFSSYRKQKITQTGKMLGIHEAENEARGFLGRNQPPVMIGDKTKAAGVLTGGPQLLGIGA